MRVLASARRSTHVAHQRAREVELRAEAHLLERLGLELGDDQVGHRLDGGVARLLAAADVGHLAEAFALVHHVEQLAAEGHLGFALGEEEEAGAGRVLLEDDAALRPCATTCRRAPAPRTRRREQLTASRTLDSATYFSLSGIEPGGSTSVHRLGQLDANSRPGGVALRRAPSPCARSTTASMLLRQVLAQARWRRRRHR